MLERLRVRRQSRHRRSEPVFLQQRDALHVMRHREDVHGPERKCDPLRSPALMRPNEPMTCGDVVLDARGLRRPVAGDCESKRAQSEPFRRRVPTVANARRESTLLPTLQEASTSQLARSDCGSSWRAIESRAQAPTSSLSLTGARFSDKCPGPVGERLQAGCHRRSSEDRVEDSHCTLMPMSGRVVWTEIMSRVDACVLLETVTFHGRKVREVSHGAM